MMWNWLRSKKDTNITIVFSPRSDDCAVHSIWNILRGFDSDDFLKMLLNKPFANFIEAFKAFFRGQTLPKCKFVFAHGHPKFGGFISITGDITRIDWWRKSVPYEIVVFHSCNGSTILAHKSWQNLSKDWISYKDQLDILSGLPEIDDYWKRIFISMLNSLRTLNSGEAIKLKFKSIYLDELSKLENLPLGSGREIMKTHILSALDSIVSKNDLV